MKNQYLYEPLLKFIKLKSSKEIPILLDIFCNKELPIIKVMIETKIIIEIEINSKKYVYFSER